MTAARLAEMARRELLYGELAADSVRDEQIAALGISSTREAIQVLDHEGLLLKEHSRPARICRSSLADLQEDSDIRGPLDTVAARRPAERGESALAEKLAALLDHLAKAEPGLTYSSRHEELHLRPTEANGRDRSPLLICTLRAQSSRTSGRHCRPLTTSGSQRGRRTALSRRSATVTGRARIRWSKRICVCRFDNCRGPRRRWTEDRRDTSVRSTIKSAQLVARFGANYD